MLDGIVESMEVLGLLEESPPKPRVNPLPMIPGESGQHTEVNHGREELLVAMLADLPLSSIHQIENDARRLGEPFARLLGPDLWRLDSPSLVERGFLDAHELRRVARLGDRVVGQV